MRARTLLFLSFGIASQVGLGVGLLSPLRAAERAPAVEEITFEGLRRVEPAAIRVVMTSRSDEPFSEAAVAEDIRAIYGMGFFQDVRVFRKATARGGLKLVYVVSEKPAVRRVKTMGNDEVSDDDIKEVIDIRPFTILSEAKVKRNLQKIKDLYNEKGFYLAEVESRIDPISDNQVEVVFQMIENAKVEVRSIRFVGNKALDDDLLKSELMTKEGDLISFLTGAGTYRKDAFQFDILRITSHYFDRGYINVKVDTPDAEISADRKYIYITIRIEEGQQYTVGALDFSGDLLLTKEELLDRVGTRPELIFNRSTLQQDLSNLKKRYEDEGYAYANITPVTAVDATARTIGLTFDIQKGQRVYYERINVVGNTKTRDKVIRRELRIYEGELTSASRRDLSQRRVTALGFFDQVEVKTRRGSREDLQIVDVEIKEKATGTFQVGAGFSSAENFIFTAQITQDNFLGRGQSMALSAQISSLRQLFQFRFTEPYFLDSEWTLSLNGFNTETRFRSFLRSAFGGDVTLGHPVTDDIRIFLTYNLEFVRSRSDGEILQPWFAALNNQGRISSLRSTLSYDTRNNRLFPSAGMFHTFSAEVSSPYLGASEGRTFQRLRLLARFYTPLFWRFIGRASLRVGWLNSGSDPGLSPSEKFVLGGINTLRGYLPFSIGPERRATRNDRGPLLPDEQSETFTFIEGGNKEFLFNLEIEFPIFTRVGIRGVLFMDSGNVYGEDENFFYIDNKVREPQNLVVDFDNLTLPLGLFWSVGFGFRWFSPIGPLRFEWGIPLTRRPSDPEGPLFEFSIGNSF